MFILKKDHQTLTVYHQVDVDHLIASGFVLVEQEPEPIDPITTPKRGRPPKAKE